MSVTSLSSATIVVRGSRSGSARDHHLTPNLDLESELGRKTIAPITNGTKKRVIDVTVTSVELGNDDDDEVLPIIAKIIEPIDRAQAALLKSDNLTEQTGSKFTTSTICNSPTRSPLGSKSQLKSISNIGQNGKSNSSNDCSKIEPSKGASTIAAAAIDASIANDRSNYQTTIKKPTIGLRSISPILISNSIVSPKSKTSTIVDPKTDCTTKPIVTNHSLISDKSSLSRKNDEISVDTASSSTEFLLSSIVTAQKELATASGKTETCLTPSPKLPVIHSCFGASKFNTHTGIISKVDGFMEPTDMLKQPNIRNKQSQAGQQGPPTSSGPQAVTARLMDMGKKLLEAARQGHTEVVRQLVVNSGAPFTSDWLGTTALHLAAQNGHAEIAEILLRGGVNRDARTKLERTALHLAAQAGSLEVVDLLLIHGSDVNARDMLKMSPLHWAVERGHLYVVEKLLSNGADVQAKSKFHLTPIDIALDSDNYEMMELIKSWTHKGKDMNSYESVHQNHSETHDILGLDYHLALADHASTSRSSMLDLNEPCMDLVELEWSTLKFEPDLFLSNEDDEDEPKVEYLMKIVEELQKENKQLRKRVEQLTTTCQ